MSQLVCYSLFLPSSEPRPDLLRQLLSSVQSLRQYNRSVPVVVFIHGDPAAELAQALAPYDVHLQMQGSFADRLARLCPSGWQILVHYPLLHKFLNFAEIAAMGPRQVLFLDCDTFFFDDVARLFQDYGEAYCYAREEPTCRRSHYGYDRQYLDEEALAQLAWSQGVRPLPPFCLGVVLFNHEIWNTLASLDHLLVSYAWRLMLWLALHPSEQRASGYGEGKAVRLLREQLARGAGAGDVSHALPYPSSNDWILEEIALWLALGHIPGLSYADFSPRHVLQNGEFLSHGTCQPDWIVCHYYSQNMSRMENWLHASASTTCQ